MTPRDVRAVATMEAAGWLIVLAGIAGVVLGAVAKWALS